MKRAGVLVLYACALLFGCAILFQFVAGCHERNEHVYILDHEGHLACIQTGESVEVDCVQAGNANVVFQTDASRSRVVFEFAQQGFELLRNPLQVRPLFNHSRITSLAISPDGIGVAIAAGQYDPVRLLISWQSEISEYELVELPVPIPVVAEAKCRIIGVSPLARYLCLTCYSNCQSYATSAVVELEDRLLMISLNGASAPWVVEGRSAWFLAGDTMFVWSGNGAARLLSLGDRSTTELGVFRCPVVSGDRRHVMDWETGMCYNLADQLWSQSGCNQSAGAAGAWISRIELIDGRHVAIWRNRLVMIPFLETLTQEHVIELGNMDSGALRCLYHDRFVDERSGFSALISAQPGRRSPLGYYLELPPARSVDSSDRK